MSNSVQEFYGNRLRTRVCGLCMEKDAILLMNHRSIREGDFWAPPGGGIEFGESAEACLMREFMEETGLTIKICDFLFACEFINKPLHSVELFFRVERIGGELKLGKDPEMNNNQILEQVRFITWNELDQMKIESLHGIFRIVTKKCEITHLNGYFKL